MERIKKKTIIQLFIKYNILLALCVICDFVCVIFALNLQNQEKIIPATSDSWTIFLFAGLLFFEMFILTFYFAGKIKKELNILKNSMAAINAQNLDISIGYSKISEIEEVLRTLEKSKEELSISLKKQWQLEGKKNTYLSAIGHDMRTPLTILKGNIELFGETMLSDIQKEYQESALLGIAKIQDYLDSLLQVVRTSKLSESKIVEFPIDELMTTIINDMTNIAKQNKIEFSVTNPYRGLLTGDKTQLERALENVIMNAFEYASDRKEVHLSISEKEAIYFEIEDSGSGFSKDTLQQGTEPFFRGDKSRTGNGHYGLGLYIAESIVKQHQGKLLLGQSERFGGAKVTLLLPFPIS